MILGIIPARSGSQGLPNKNLLPVGGKPLLVRAIEAASSSGELDDFIVSTDSSEYASVALAAGGKAPFIRPSELAAPDTGMADVIRHAVEWYETEMNVRVDYAAVLQPTTPLRTHQDIDSCIRLFLSNPGAESLITCFKASAPHPAIMYTLDGNQGVPLLSTGLQGVPRQAFPDVYIRNGVVYICSRRLLFEEGVIMSGRPLVYVMPFGRSVNVDTAFDLEISRMLHGRPDVAGDG